MIENAIYIEGLSRAFGQVLAVDDLTLQVPRGSIFGFLGPNGAGKTTTIRLLLGLLEPTVGRVEVLGFDTRAQAVEIRARTGALLENNGLYEQLSAENNLEFYGRAYHMPQVELKARIKDLLTGIGLWERRRELVKKWSRGMKQKLALARAMLHNPPLVMLDEPTAGLDVSSAVEVRHNLATLAVDQGVTVFLTTHNMTEAEKLCNQIAVIRQGRLVALGHPDELRAGVGKPKLEIVARGLDDRKLEQLRAHPDVIQVQSRNDHLTIDLKENADSSALVGTLVGAGVQVDEVHRGVATLEEVFLTLMEEERK